MAADPFDFVLGQFGSRFDSEVLEATLAHWRHRVNLQIGQQAPSVEYLSYGNHARHRIDVFPVKASGAPIVLFVHGGGFIAGDKQFAPPFYSNLGRYVAALGIVGACMNYRLTPVGGWPAGAEDVDLAVRWLVERGDLYGGDPKRLVIVGQSAGACHVSTWLFEPRFAGRARDSLSGAVLMSCFYTARPPLTPGQCAYFGDATELYRVRSPLSIARKLPHPVLVTIAEHDPVRVRSHGQELASALEANGANVTLSDLPHHNHVSPLMSIGSDNDETGSLLRRFIADATAFNLPDIREGASFTTPSVLAVNGAGTMH